MLLWWKSTGVGDQGQAATGPGTSWDNVGLEKGRSGQNLGGDTVLLQVTCLFRCVPWACLWDVYWGWKRGWEDVDLGNGCQGQNPGGSVAPLVGRSLTHLACVLCASVVESLFLLILTASESWSQPMEFYL